MQIKYNIVVLFIAFLSFTTGYLFRALLTEIAYEPVEIYQIYKEKDTIKIIDRDRILEEQIQRQS